MKQSKTCRFGNTPMYDIDEAMASALSADDYGRAIGLWSYLQSVANWTTQVYNVDGVQLKPCEAVYSVANLYKTKRGKMYGSSLRTAYRHADASLDVLKDYGLITDVREEYNTIHHKTIIVRLNNVNDTLIDAVTRQSTLESSYNRAEKKKEAILELQRVKKVVCMALNLNCNTANIEEIYTQLKRYKIYEKDIQSRFSADSQTLAINSGEGLFEDEIFCDGGEDDLLDSAIESSLQEDYA